MSRTKKPRKAYRPRRVAINTMEMAVRGAAKPARADRDEVLAVSESAINALCAGAATEADWSIAAGMVNVALAIERQGVVRGLREHLASADAVLCAIYNRCRTSTMWLRPTLTIDEIDAMRLLQDLHAFQVNQLSRTELLTAIDMAIKHTHAQGCQATVAYDLERLAA
jgi:hypothetical protein